jgi:hypothetical protein
MELISAAMDPYQRWKVMSEGERREREDLSEKGNGMEESRGALGNGKERER